MDEAPRCTSAMLQVVVAVGAAAGGEEGDGGGVRASLPPSPPPASLGDQLCAAIIVMPQVCSVFKRDQMFSCRQSAKSSNCLQVSHWHLSLAVKGFLV